MFSLRFDFPTEWSTFVNGTADFVVTLRKDHFPYLVQSAKSLVIDALTLYPAGGGGDQRSVDPKDPKVLSGDLSSGAVTLTLPSDNTVLTTGDASKQVFLLLQYHLE